ncbi:helix-turn-helix transcriptional regulator [Cohnella abietis]|uniref:Transcriptional regulator n=1 Tax=Cohnella abietis TaxID=2507935 RepID=A0A3T1D808_9BACL|nr:metalloregulator ArsR/SmtB family transcription factor [Cohnella abietis]BBI34203.1 transcriptional regulator [Cohnella abietis]
MNAEQDLSTRERIMQMLKTMGELSTKDITAQLGITGMAVRRHISALERDELIESTTVRLPMGRPTAVYRLSAKAEDFFPKKYHAVALDLLSELEGDSGQEMVNRLFDLRKISLLKKLENKMQGRDLEGKVAMLSDIQNENGYMASWEKSGHEEYILTEYNCPIYQVANKYNHACSCELSLFKSLLDAKVERSDCLAKGGSKCVYHIRA